MRNMKSRIAISVILMAIGLALFIVGSLSNNMDSFWPGMGMALVAVSALRLIKMGRYMRNDDYRKKMNIQSSDERNIFVAGKAAYAALKYSMLVEGIGILVLYIFEMNIYGFTVAMVMCAQLLIYYGSYLVINKRS